MINPQPPVPDLQVFWGIIYSGSDTDAFVREVAHYLGQCVPLKLVVSPDLTAGETQYLETQMEKMRSEVSQKLISMGLPIPKREGIVAPQ
jgi:hypothetical protein